MNIKWICNQCGKETNAKPPHKNSTCKFCHRGRFYAVKKCVICKKTFKPNCLKVQCCSRKCRNKLMSIKPSGKLGKHYPHLQRAKIRKCLVCGKEFRAIGDFTGKTIRKQKYCNKECWSRRNPPSIKKCLYCKNKFRTYERNKVYCCRKCRDKDYRTRLKGKNSHFWKGGKTEKSKLRKTCAKYKEWREKVFKRDNWTCQNCGIRSKKDVSIYLEAHHIKPQSEYPKLIYNINNGQTLCKKCHRNTDSYGAKQRSKLLLKGGKQPPEKKPKNYDRNNKKRIKKNC